MAWSRGNLSKRFPIRLRRELRSADTDCQGRAPVVIAPISADSLRKTGILRDWAGDFQAFRPGDRQIGSVETQLNARKARISKDVRGRLQSMANPRTAWLT